MMKWNRLSSFLVLMGAVGLVLSPINVNAQAASAGTPVKAKQDFKLAPKSKGKSFIDFGKLDNKLFSEAVKFKAKTDADGNKKPAAKFDFGAPITDPADGSHTVSVELVSLSLVSVDPVPLDLFFEDFKGEGTIALSLAGKKQKAKLPVKLNDKAEDKKRQGKKAKGTFKDSQKKPSFKVKKNKLKLSAKENGVKKKKEIPKLKLKALDAVNFAFASPITITDPSFCLADGDKASICLSPIAASPIPVPGAFALMAPALSALFLGHLIRRRRLKGDSSLAASSA